MHAFIYRVPNSCMRGARTTTALWWVPKPASLGCSLQPDAQLPSCPTYSGGLFPCTPSPGPRTRWAAEPHKYFLSCCIHRWKRNLCKLILSLCSSLYVCVVVNPAFQMSPTLWSGKWTYNCTHKTFSTRSRCASFLLMLLCFHFLKLLKSPGKDCPRFRTLMTETFESETYQRFLKAHQVSQTTKTPWLRINCTGTHPHYHFCPCDSSTHSAVWVERNFYSESCACEPLRSCL